MSCYESLSNYAFRSIGLGERRLPLSDITLCDQIVLIGSGMIWNIYFAVIALGAGFFFSATLAFAKAGPNPFWRGAASTFIFVLRGSPLFIQFFIVYQLFVLLPKVGVTIPLGFTELTAETRWLTRAWLGAALVLFLNTSAYTAHIFYGALKSVPAAQVEAAQALGLTRRQINRLILWPAMLRVGWASYTNETIFLFHATALVFFSSFPAWRQSGDALYYASYFADKTFNPFVPYPIIAVYFILCTLVLIGLMGAIGKRLSNKTATRT
ncbi:MAG: ABC transporter permease subunit [Pseudomonadota bacterium]